jgi:thiol-disulfide isomerase/thioredoxin
MTTPLDLQFTALDGTKVDAKKLRGKIILIDFWATWCAPCMEEVPDVVKTYKDLHPAGLEIIGISLDQDKSLLTAVTRAQGMPWPQYFDGNGWQNTISSGFCITQIPTMWLVDKKGMVVDTDAADGLEDKVKALLAK